MLLRSVLNACVRPFAVPKRRISLYAVGWYLFPYEVFGLLVGLFGYGVLGPGVAAAVVVGLALVLALVVGGFRVLPHADWTGKL
jgi:hypothetical protein